MINEMKKLINELSEYCDSYYNRNISLISDYEYDKKYDRLVELEKLTGIIYPNSPTQKVGYEVVSELEKVEHNHPMLSLDKTKDLNDIIKFLGINKGISMLKMDGLTISLMYKDGSLVRAETRGNGHIGENVLHTVKQFTNVPLNIPIKEDLIVDGEAIIQTDDFKTLNKINENKLKAEAKIKGLDTKETEEYIKENLYKNPRNLCSGSVRQLNSEITKLRKVKFIAWKCIEGCLLDSFSERLEFLNSLGFEVVPYVRAESQSIHDQIEYLKQIAEEKHYPIDGIVFSYDSIRYSKSLGQTSHHVRSQIAYKFYDEEVETVLKDIEWTMGRTGVLTPTAVFEPVEIDGTEVERASLHNISVMHKILGETPHRGQTVYVSKMNMIIPQIVDSDREFSIHFNLTPPQYCPLCGGKTSVKMDNDSKILMCTNDSCKGKLLGRLSNFVSKEGMNIEGLSKKTLEKLIDVGVLSEYKDIYELKYHKTLLFSLEGFGRKKVNNLLNEIEDSRNVSLKNFLVALGIPGIGVSTCKLLAQSSKDDYYSFEVFMDEKFKFPDLGPATSAALISFWEKHREEIEKLSSLMFWDTQNSEQKATLSGMTFVITGTLEQFSNRKELVEFIESRGGKVSGSVSKNTTYLINNDLESKSSKNKKAKELGVKIVPESFLKNF